MFDALGELVIVVLFLLLIYFVWKSTDVRETHFLVAPIATTNHPSIVRNADVAIVPVRGTLLHRLVDQITTGSSGLRNRRRRTRLTNNNNSVEEIEYNEGNILMTHVLSWASNDNSISQGTNTEASIRQGELITIDDDIEGGPAAIIREMDRDLGSAPPNAAAPTEEMQNCTNENNENGQRPEGESGQITADSVDGGEEKTNATADSPPPAIDDESAWRIKIKYLNDDMKVVEAKPSQSLGAFKKRNFESELAANKLVRLVFNGKVLQPDGASLRSFALFEDCVVHCLVHNMPANRTQPAQQQQQQQQVQVYQERDVIGGGVGGLLSGGQPAEEQQQQADGEGGEGNYSAAHLMRTRFQQWLLQQWTRIYCWRFFTETLLFAFTVGTVYIRIRYAELFTATATIGLILTTAMILGISVTLNIL